MWFFKNATMLAKYTNEEECIKTNQIELGCRRMKHREYTRQQARVWSSEQKSINK